MSYTIKQLADLAGVTPRTLRWYERQGLLAPKRGSNGYRSYTSADVNRLQQVLFFRELGFELREIARTLNDPNYNAAAALGAHLQTLNNRRDQLDELIGLIHKTLKTIKGETTMSDTEKFAAFKREQLRQNEAAYGTEIREKYGEETVAASNAQFMGLSESEFAQMEALTQRLHMVLQQAVAAGDPKGALAREVAELHKQWLSFFWPTYSTEAHRGVTQMYVDDLRFTAHYEEIVPNGATFLRDAVWAWSEGEE